MKLVNNKKIYYTNEISKLLGVSKKTLFNWEKSGKIPIAKRDPMNNYRYYTEDDIKFLKKLTER